MKRNIRLAYFLSFAFHSWFWMGNWIFYYLSFGNYSTVALLDSGAVMADLLAEIPTGAFTDMIGKKKALMIAFVSAGLGNILMGVAGNFWMLALSLWLLVCVGGAFYSGTMEALVYDSLKQLKDERSFDKVIGGVNAMRLLAMATCSVVGGFAYYLYPGMPLILNGLVDLIGLIACFYLVEPHVDTEKYSWLDFFKQNTQGVRTLFSTNYLKKLSLYLAVTGALALVIYNILDDLLAVEWGFSPIGISYLFAVVAGVAGIASALLPRMKIKLNERFILISTMIVMGFLLMLSPLTGMLFGGLLLLFRVILEVFYDNATSVLVNHQIGSEVRATTLSSLNLLRSIPYALGGSFIGLVVERAGGARQFSMWYGLIIIVLAIIFGLRIERRKSENTDEVMIAGSELISDK